MCIRDSTNTLNLFDLDTIDESIVHDGIAFDKTAIDKNLTLFLYPCLLYTSRCV